MTLLDMLQQLYNSLDEIEVKGKRNLDLLLGSMMAIERMMIIARDMPKDGEKNGRQADIGTDTSDCAETN